VTKALLDTDILSEVEKGSDPTVARNATTYRSAFGRSTLSVIGRADLMIAASARVHGQAGRICLSPARRVREEQTPA